MKNSRVNAWKSFPAGSTVLESQAPRRRRGFTVIELITVVAVGLIVAAIAIPLIRNVSSFFIFRGSVASVTGAIQSTRYLAISRGCQTSLVLSSAGGTYQVQTTETAANQCNGALTNIGAAVPLSGTGNSVTLDKDVTFTFHSGGKVDSTTFDNVALVTTMVLTQGKRTATVTITAYGSVHVVYT